MKEIVQNRSASEQNTRVADIFRKYQAQLKGFISRRVSSKEDSEDILQNVFYQFMKYDQEDSPIEQIAAWLYSVARSQIIDRSRKHREEEMPYLSANEEDGTFLKELGGAHARRRPVAGNGLYPFYRLGRVGTRIIGIAGRATGRL